MEQSQQADAHPLGPVILSGAAFKYLADLEANGCPEATFNRAHSNLSLSAQHDLKIDFDFYSEVHAALLKRFRNFVQCSESSAEREKAAKDMRKGVKYLFKFQDIKNVLVNFSWCVVAQPRKAREKILAEWFRHVPEPLMSTAVFHLTHA